MEAPSASDHTASADAAPYPETATSATPGSGNVASSDAELDEIARRVKETQDEAERLEALQKQVAEQMGPGGAEGGINPQEVDSRSVFVGNVDYATVPTELEEHFKSCGAINRVTILCDRFTGTPKGFAYVEFVDSSSVAAAVALNESQFRGRPLKVSVKRTNVPGLGRGGGRGGFGGGYGGPYGGYGGGPGYMRGRGFAPRRFNPYFRPRGRRPYG